MNENIFQIYRKRIDHFVRSLENSLFADYRLLNAELYHTQEPVYWKDRLKGDYRPVVEMEKWGKLWDSAWIHLSGAIPPEWEGHSVVMRLEMGGEIMIFDSNGMPLYALTNTSIFVENYKKTLYCVTDNAKPNQLIDYYVEIGVNGLVGEESDPSTPSKHECGFCRHMKICLFRSDIWDLLNDCRVLLSLLDSYCEGNYRKNQLLICLYEAANTYTDTHNNVQATRIILAKELSRPANNSEFNVTAVGHAHIDVGWLWPVRESIRKAARTYANQLANIDDYDDYIFGGSQPQLYHFVKEYYPNLFEKIKCRVKEGRWELQGGMWVEADCNLISGESMIRQFVHGKNFFMDEFGVDVKNLWLPDVFGYSAALPQIIRKSGCNYFLTTKLSWSQINKFPYKTFLWRGIDGTEVMTHFPNGYNGTLDPKSLILTRDTSPENHFIPEFLSLFGVGDGGGGPKPEHIENGLRTANLEGCPKVKFGRADTFFENLEKYSSQLPQWDGELYLELHRGTFTTQARTKRGNRKCEQLLSVTEFIYSCLPLELYPQSELDYLWKLLLMNQFHDIIPGSSIHMVYEQAEREYTKIIESCNKLIQDATSRLVIKDGNSVTLVNTLSYSYVYPVQLPLEWRDSQVTDSKGNILQTQIYNDQLWVNAKLEQQSFTRLHRVGEGKRGNIEFEDDLLLENDLIRYEFNLSGELIRAYDKAEKRETIIDISNLLSLYTDKPNNYDAWDIDFTYRDMIPEHPVCVSKKKTSNGPLLHSLVFELKIGKSYIQQQIVLPHNTKRLDFITKVNWRERYKMLRVAFAPSTRASEAACDIQYGFVKRPTHQNTSWDFAKFEVAAHRYVDISDNNNGAALLNDCKYGYCIHDNVIDLNLLRSPTWPDEEADQGQHEFTYSFLPHSNSLVESNVIQEAVCLNRPPLLLYGNAENAEFPVRLTESNGVSLEVIKKAEKENLIIFRLVETKGQNSQATLSVHADKMQETNLIEWEKGKKIKLENGRTTLSLDPFEIKTFQFKHRRR